MDAEEAEVRRGEGKRCSEVFLGKVEGWEETKAKLFRASSTGKYVLVKDYITHYFPVRQSKSPPSNCIWLNFEAEGEGH